MEIYRCAARVKGYRLFAILFTYARAIVSRRWSENQAWLDLHFPACLHLVPYFLAANQ